MHNIVIVNSEDSTDIPCETCGDSWASSLEVFIDGESVIGEQAVAGCLNGSDQAPPLTEIIQAVLLHFGIESSVSEEWRN